MRSRVRLSPEACQTISLDAFKIKVLDENHSKGYYKSLAKLNSIFSKNIYKNHQELLEDYKKNIDLVNNTQSSRKIVSKFLNYLKDEGFSQENIVSCKKLLKKDINFSNDTYVPTDQEIKVTLSKLREDLKPLYLLFLFSGIRVSEGIYLLNNLNNLKIQCKDNYCKIHLDYNRHNKRSFFCYIPHFIYTQIGVQKTELNNIRIFIKRNKLIPLKYCRKWFYTKCIELGIPESIADFYQGRVSSSVGANHYLSRQFLADKHYTKIYGFFKVFFKI
ncbi:MAG: integrase [Candidatus ainarchaeum sp.]|nr:integrase [Candidatus ainarchaeum sp.]